MSHQESEHEAEEREPRHGKNGPRKAKPFGIRYAYRRWWRTAEKWYVTRTGRDQAFTRMDREVGKLYGSIEKIEK